MKPISYEILYLRTRLHTNFIWPISWNFCPETRTAQSYRELREEALR